MVEGLDSAQLAEMEAFARIEADPEGEEARQARLAAAEAERLEALKNPFLRASRAAEEARNGDRRDA